MRNRQSTRLVCFFALCAVQALCAEKCELAKNCAECMGLGPTCSWCYDDAYDDTAEGPGYRCSQVDVLTSRGCPAEKIENPISKVVTNEGSGGTEGEQLLPSLSELYLRPKETFSTNFTFQSISDYPVDLYFLVDLSYTMRDDLDTVSRVTEDIVSALQKVTKQLRLGFGAFVDKPVFPFVVPTREALANPCLSGVGNEDLHCDPPFLYKHILSLTDDFDEFRQKTKLARPSGNLDSPEGGLDALLQVAVCDEYVGWRNNTRKIVIFATDGGFHLAGDGRLAGLVLPPPTTCQLTFQADRFNKSIEYLGWHTADQTDYPSVGQVAHVLAENDISVIFATSARLSSLYKQLAESLPSAEVGILTGSSTNIVNLIRENYEKIANRAELTVIYDTEALEVQVETKCSNEQEFTKNTVCKENPVGGRIEYKISVKAKICFIGEKEVSLNMVALEDRAVIKVRSACDCSACLTSAPSNMYSPRCQSRGQLVCGACQCQAGYTGDFCECSTATTEGGDDALLASCIGPNSTEQCSGRGRCICGRCKCNLPRYQGPFCECDRHGCKRASDDNQVCGGPQRGECQCDRTCHCKPGYTGDRCDCMDDNRNCYDPSDLSKKCSNRGVCDCGQCFCNPGFTGQLCNEIQGGESALCTDRDVEKCVLCLRKELIGEPGKEDEEKTPELAEDGGFVVLSEEAMQQCSPVCSSTVVDINRVKILEEANQKEGFNLCIIYAEDSCRIMFTYRYSDNIYATRKVDLNLVRKSECTKTINIFFIVLGVVAGIVLGGLILLLIYKLVITIDDRRELAKFKLHNENVHWEMAENPIFEPPTTRIMNPAFSENGY